jgi:hypothetical protein
MISEPMVRLAQTVHLFWTDTNTVSKWTEMRFQMAHATYEFYLECPKWFLSLRYVRHKPCTYFASRLALPPNGPKRASTWGSSPRSTIQHVQEWFLSLCYVWCKQCTYLASRLALSSNGPKRTSTWAKSPRSTIRCIQKWFMSLWYIWRK